MGLPIFLLRIAKRERWQNMPPTTAHRPDRIVTHNKLLRYFTATYSTSVYRFLVYSNHQSTLLLEHLTHIAQWRRSRASLEATGCRHWVSIMFDNKKGTYLRQFFVLFFIVNTLKTGAKQKDGSN